MKKIFYLMVAVCAMSFASCGVKSQSAAADVDSTAVDSVEVDSVVTDTLAIDTAVCVL